MICGGNESKDGPAGARRSVAASFHCLVEEWKDCEELKLKRKEKWVLVDKERGKRSIERSGVLRPTTKNLSTIL